jgi:hypothetical protein
MMNMARTLMIATSPVLALAAGTALAQNAGAEYQSMLSALSAVEQRGVTHVEEIEVDRRGRIAVEGVDSQGIEFQARFDRDGTLLHERGGDHEGFDDSIDLAAARRVIGWLQQQGHRDIEQIAADDGLVEVELRDANGREVEIALEPESLRVVSLEGDGDLRDFVN